jgi:hypothetical protein
MASRSVLKSHDQFPTANAQHPNGTDVLGFSYVWELEIGNWELTGRFFISLLAVH